MNNEKEDLTGWFNKRIENVKRHMDESDYETHIEYLKCDSIGEQEINPVKKLVFQRNSNPTNETLKMSLEQYYNRGKSITSEYHDLRLEVALYELKEQQPERFDNLINLSF
jgi:predicted ATPase